MTTRVISTISGDPRPGLLAASAKATSGAASGTLPAVDLTVPDGYRPRAGDVVVWRPSADVSVSVPSKSSNIASGTAYNHPHLRVNGYGGLLKADPGYYIANRGYGPTHNGSGSALTLTFKGGRAYRFEYDGTCWRILNGRHLWKWNGPKTLSGITEYNTYVKVPWFKRKPASGQLHAGEALRAAFYLSAAQSYSSAARLHFDCDGTSDGGVARYRTASSGLSQAGKSQFTANRYYLLVANGYSYPVIAGCTANKSVALHWTYSDDAPLDPMDYNGNNIHLACLTSSPAVGSGGVTLV